MWMMSEWTDFLLGGILITTFFGFWAITLRLDNMGDNDE